MIKIGVFGKKKPVKKEEPTTGEATDTVRMGAGHEEEQKQTELDLMTDTGKAQAEIIKLQLLESIALKLEELNETLKSMKE